MHLKSLVSEPITSATLEGFEQQLGKGLPADYRTFLMNNNGAEPVPMFAFAFRDTTGKMNRSVIRYFLCLQSNDHSIVETLSELDYRLLSHYVPIAEDPFGNLVLLSVLPDDYGHVYFWDHELEEDEPTLKNMSLIADSFTNFMAGLTEYEP